MRQWRKILRFTGLDRTRTAVGRVDVQYGLLRRDALHRHLQSIRAQKKAGNQQQENQFHSLSVRTRRRRRCVSPDDPPESPTERKSVSRLDYPPYN